MPDTNWYTEDFPDICDDPETRIKLVSVLSERFEAHYEPEAVLFLKFWGTINSPETFIGMNFGLVVRKKVYEDLTTGAGYCRLITLELFPDHKSVQNFALSVASVMTNYLSTKFLKPK